MLFCGINPGLLSAQTGHNFARPGNRFWPALHGAGFTPRRLSPQEDGLLPTFGLGITNLVDRPSRGESDLSPDELRAGAVAVEALVRRHRPHVLAMVGIGAYRVGFGRPRATVGLQAETVAGVPVWVLPNTSGLNANHQLPQLIEQFAALRDFALKKRRGPAGAGPSLSEPGEVSVGECRSTGREAGGDRAGGATEGVEPTEGLGGLLGGEDLVHGQDLADAPRVRRQPE